MKHRTTILHRALLATGIAVGMGLSQTALAETASDDLEITAGLIEALTLSCDTALSFGITRLTLEGRTGSTTITVAASDGATTLSGYTSGVTAGTGVAGVCTISGSAADENDPVTVKIGGTEADLIATGVSVDLEGNASAFDDLAAPDPALTGLAVTELGLNGPVTIDNSGGATFQIGGDLTIPQTVVTGNLGGYSTTITVEVDDGFGD